MPSSANELKIEFSRIRPKLLQHALHSTPVLPPLARLPGGPPCRERRLSAPNRSGAHFHFSARRAARAGPLQGGTAHQFRSPSPASPPNPRKFVLSRATGQNSLSEQTFPETSRECQLPHGAARPACRPPPLSPGPRYRWRSLGASPRALSPALLQGTACSPVLRCSAALRARLRLSGRKCARSAPSWSGKMETSALVLHFGAIREHSRSGRRRAGLHGCRLPVSLCRSTRSEPPKMA